MHSQKLIHESLYKSVVDNCAYSLQHGWIYIYMYLGNTYRNWTLINVKFDWKNLNRSVFSLNLIYFTLN